MKLIYIAESGTMRKHAVITVLAEAVITAIAPIPLAGLPVQLLILPILPALLDELAPAGPVAAVHALPCQMLLPLQLLVLGRRCSAGERIPRQKAVLLLAAGLHQQCQLCCACCC